MRRVLRPVCMAGALLLVLAAMPSHATPGIDVRHYRATIEPDIAGKRLRGSVRIDFALQEEGTYEVLFDAGSLEIDTVSEHGDKLAFAKDGKQLRIQLRGPAAAGERHRIDIDYHGAPAFGLEFHPERSEVYTIFSTSQWMVSIDAPEERATLDLRVVLPRGLEAVGTGRLVSRKPLEGGREVFRWRQRSAMPAYVYGFAAGRYRVAEARQDASRLRYLSAERSPEELRRIFADTGDMLDFFGDRAGLPYRGEYAQVLVADTIGQELDGLALLSEDHGRKVLDGSATLALIAHEAAHQWWGNRITCRSWGDFWLNEGFANFMAAAYLQHRFGEAAYRREVDRWRARLDRLRADGKDRPLVFAHWIKPSADDRAVVYQKGAYVLHLLREALGERAFWTGIRAYSRAHDGRAVETADFRRAMETASGRDLSAFFARWIELPRTPAASASGPSSD